MFECSPVFYENYKATADVVINQGGTDSGKTYAIMQLLFTYATTTKAPDIDPIITVVGESIPNLKKGAYRHAKTIAGNSPALKKYIKSWNETDRIIVFHTGWIMEFISCETEQSAKNGKRQYLFVNEANGIPYNIFWQLSKRARVRSFIDYNPTQKFWAHEKLIGTAPGSNDLGATVQLIISDHRHNPFLSEADHRKTENIPDKELWRVYARGMTGMVDGVIFPNWKRIPNEEYPWDEPFWGAIDYGTNDPTAGVRMCRIDNDIYIHELCYTPGLTATQIKDTFTANGFTPNHTIYTDHNKKNLNSELQRLRFARILPAKKGPDSIEAGIKKFKEYNVYYTASSIWLHDELSKYVWLKNPLTNEKTSEPIDAFNHLLDASRYALYSHYYK